MLKLKPGILVSLTSRIEPGVQYRKIDKGRRKDGAALITYYEVTKTIEDKKEHDKAVDVRAKARNHIRGACVWSPFGLICPTDNAPQLEERLGEARGWIDEFNAKATTYRIQLHYLPAIMAESSRDAVAAIRGELGHLLDMLKQAASAGDIKAIREVAKNAKALNKLQDDASPHKGAVEQAIGAARKLASTIAEQVEKAGASLETVLAEERLQPIATARFQLLGEDVEAPAGGVLTAASRFVTSEEAAAIAGAVEAAGPTPEALEAAGNYLKRFQQVPQEEVAS